MKKLKPIDLKKEKIFKNKLKSFICQFLAYYALRLE